jgi:VanZ family protein
VVPWLPQAHEGRLARYLGAAYLLVIAYASLSPFGGWSSPGTSAFAFLAEGWPRYVSKFDLAINLLAYLPLGLLLTLGLLRWLPAWAAALAGMLLCLLASTGLETAQMYLPGRVASTLDIAFNAAGGALGALLAARTGRLPLGARSARARDRCCLPAAASEPGLALVGLWFLTQLDPSTPLLAVLPLPAAAPIPGTGFVPPRDFSEQAAALVGINTLAASAFVMTLMRRRWHALVAMCMLVAGAAVIKLLAALAMLKPDALLIWTGPEVAVGLAAGMLLAAGLLGLRRRGVLTVGIVALLGSFVALHLLDDPRTPVLPLWPFQWNYGQLLNYTGLARTVAEVWPLVAAGFLYGLRRRLRGSAAAPRPL